MKEKKVGLTDKEAMIALIAGKRIQHETVANGYLWLDSNGKFWGCSKDDGTERYEMGPFWNDGKWNLFGCGDPYEWN